MASYPMGGVWGQPRMSDNNIRIPTQELHLDAKHGKAAFEKINLLQVVKSCKKTESNEDIAIQEDKVACQIDRSRRLYCTRTLSTGMVWLGLLI